MKGKNETKVWVVALLLTVMMLLTTIPFGGVGSEVSGEQINTTDDDGGIVLKAPKTLIFGKEHGYVYTDWNGDKFTYIIYGRNGHGDFYYPDWTINGPTSLGGGPLADGGVSAHGSALNSAFVSAGLLMYGNVTVKEGKYLTFRAGSELVINSTYEGEHHIKVENATFRLWDNSRIWVWSPYKYDFIGKNATLNITYSEIRDVRYFEIGENSTVYMENSSLVNTSYGMHLKNMKKLWLLNNTGDPIFVENSTAMAVFSSNDNTTLLNTTVNRCGSHGGNLTIEWYLHVKVVDSGGNPVPRANVKITDALGNVRELSTGDDGELRWIILPQIRYNSDGSTTVYGPYKLNAENNGVYSSDVSLDMTESKSITLILGENTNCSVDLSISNSDISFSNGSPKAGENVTISAIIHGDYDVWENTTNSEVLFSDDFDDGTLDKWYVGPWNPDGVMELTNNVSHSPNYSAHSQSDPNTNTAPYIRAYFNESNDLLIEGWIYLPQKTQEYDRFRLLQTNNKSAEYLIGMMLYDDDYSLDIIEDTTTNTDLLDSDQKIMDIYELQPETWYKLGLKINGFDYSIYINDSLVYNGTRTKSMPLDSIFFGDAGGDSGVWGDAYLDDVTVIGYEETQTLTHKAQNATCTVSFYLDEVNESKLIYREDNVFVPANGEVTVTAPWTAVEGNHTIIVKVTDVNPDDRDYSNNEAFKTISVSSVVKGPDLSISPEDISYSFNNTSCSCPCHWDTINISAKVHNIGDLDATCTVSFYIDEVNPEHLIYREYGVYVPAGNYTVVSHEWFVHMESIPIEGNHSLIVNITDSDPLEQNLANNQASKPIYIDEPQNKLRVKVSTDKQKYIKGVDTEAIIIVKVTSRGELIDNATVSAWVIDPNGNSTQISMTQQASGIYTGTYGFTDNSSTGTYRIKAMAEKEGYISGENEDSKDKFFLKESGCGGKSVKGVEISDPIVKASEDGVTITAEINDYQTVSSVYAEIRKHKDSLDVKLPLYDDGTHGDVSANDGIFTGILEISGFSGTYIVDIWVDEIYFENRGVFSVNNPDVIAVDTITDMESENGYLEIVSENTNTSIGLNLASDISNVSFTIVEHRTEGSGKSIEIIPTENVDVAMVGAQIKVKYSDEDIPNGTNESDMRIYVFNIYTGEWEVCTPGWVSLCDDTIWGETAHFSNFTIKSAPYTYAAKVVHTGWNLLTLPWVTSPMKIEDALYSIEWDRAMVYIDGRWYTYDKNRAPKYNIGFPLVDNTMGIYVHVTGGDTLIGSYNKEIISTNIHLKKGWNLIGYPSEHDIKVSVLLSEIPWKYLETVDVNGNEYYLSADSYMISGMAYWIYVTEDCEITVNW